MDKNQSNRIPPAAEAEVPRDILEDYEVLTCLAYKEEKQIFKLMSKKNGSRFLLKCARGAALELLRTEAGWLDQIRRPFLPELIWFREEPGQGYLLRKYVEGITLWDRVETYGPLPEEEAVSRMLDLCKILKELHRRNPPVIYRDLKPQNLIVTPDGRLVLIDMETARSYKEDAKMDTVFMGTKATAAPEQFGYCQTDARADLYGAGILFYYMLTGCLKIGESEADPPARLMRIIKTCTRFSPEKRYRDAGILERKLAAVRREIIRRRKALFLHAAAAAVLAVVILTSLVRSRNQGEEAIKFSSRILEQAVLRELQKEDGEPVYEEELAGITKLLICGTKVFDSYDEHYQYYLEHVVNDVSENSYGDIKDISLLSKMENLRFLVLDRQNISDLSPLSGLSLEALSVCGNPLSDVEALSRCTRLREVRLEETGVGDISPLSSLPFLETLDVSHTYVEDLEPLSGSPVKELYLIGADISDYGALENMSVRRLWVLKIKPDDVRLIGRLDRLESLTIYDSRIENFDDLSGLHQLTELDLHSNALRALDGIENFPELIRLCIGNNPLNDLSGLEHCPQLERLEMEETPAKDYRALNQLRNLKYLSVSEEKRPFVESAVAKPWFTVSSQSP